MSSLVSALFFWLSAPFLFFLDPPGSSLLRDVPELAPPLLTEFVLILRDLVPFSSRPPTSTTCIPLAKHHSNSFTKSTAHSASRPFFLLCCNRFYVGNKLYFEKSNRDHSKMKNESVKKSPEKSKNVPEEKGKRSSKKFA